jgi:serine/threonine protein kinase
VKPDGSFGGWSGGGWSHPGDSGGEEPDRLAFPEGERYERVDLLGVGGMGRVYEAWDRKLCRTVALKEVAPQLAHSPAAKRLATEAMLTADLDHPGIVSVHDAGRTDAGRLYYTMRLVRGDSLADLLLAADSPRERAVLLRHLLDVCHAVGYAHRRGVVHRDLKPSNIVIGAFGETQVVDWGLARRIDEGKSDGGSAGTEGYMSPESAAGGGAHRGPTSGAWA